MKTIDFMGAKIHAITMKKTIKIAEEFIKSGKPHQHVVVNVAKIVNMQKDKKLYDDVINADLINADGQGIIWGARILGKKLPERVSGIDLFVNLLKLSEKKGYSVFFLGAKQEVLEKMVNNINRRYSRINIAGYRNGYFTDNEQKEIADQIKKSKAQLLFVGISSPKKEKFIRSQLKNTGVSFAMGVGGSFDIIAGITKRAPLWMQNNGLEWFYRTLQEPRRMYKRYLTTNSLFLWLLIKEVFKLK
ncbi:MAG: WecB/TagA/CpsF family glycosyltransferase [Nanoarchaeota archaeon]|nr:WecB/TagA/CpsF family glycosyltransferase [Nanoarchaeota archaeon]